MRENEFIAIAILKPFDGRERECLEIVRELYSTLRQKNYSRDILYHDPSDGRWINVRHWMSELAREQAHEDPDIHRLWQRLGQVCTVEKVRERLEEVDLDSAP